MNVSNIREHMKVLGSDRQPVGTVDHLQGNEIKLRKNDPQAGGKHHYIPADWVDRVEGEEVCLNKPANEATQQWRSD